MIRAEAQLAVLADALDRAYAGPSWHGPSLRAAIRRVTAREAAWRAGPRRKSIGELVLHAAYWKYAARRRLAGLKRGSFVLGGSNWFKLEKPWNDAAWKRAVALLDAEHTALRAAVAELKPARLNQRMRGSIFTPAQLVLGVAMHDVYHAGQVQTLKRLCRAKVH